MDWMDQRTKDLWINTLDYEQKTNGKRKRRKNMAEVKMFISKNLKYWGENKTNQIQYSQIDVNYPMEAITK